MTGEAGRKAAQLEHDSVTPTKNDHYTTDYGVKQGNTEDWLGVVNDESTGPLLLEDSFGREKVCRDPQLGPDVASSMELRVLTGYPLSDPPI